MILLCIWLDLMSLCVWCSWVVLMGLRCLLMVLCSWFLFISVVMWVSSWFCVVMLVVLNSGCVNIIF